MKLKLVVLSITAMLLACKTSVNIVPTKNDTNLAVKSSRFRGTVFKTNYPFYKFFVLDVDSTKRFTPTKEDVELAEKILSNQLAKANRDRPNQVGRRPIIHRRLNNYFRQYVGVFTSDNERIIHINFYWDKYSITERWKGFHDGRLNFEDDYAIVFDGGSKYWQINVNLTKQCLSDLHVNGAA